MFNLKKELCMRYSFFKHNQRSIATLLLMLVFGVSMYAQQITIKGVVTEAANGEPIIGANIIEKGTTNGTITNFDGEFSLSVQSNATVIIKYVGFQDQEIAVAGKTSFVIQMKEDAIALQEVVAIGYGSQKKKEITGAVTSIKPENFNKGVQNSAAGLLQGKVAGLTVQRKGGDPTNTGYEMQIRGFSTLDQGAGTKPLFIVDGIPVNNIDNISPEEIESMDVLKDGSAAAIYGTRGTNGVIIITTKRGSGALNANSMAVEYSTYISTSTIAGKTGMASPKEFRDLAALSNNSVSPVIFSENDTYWLNEITRTAPITHSHNLAITGGNESFNYRGSVSYKNSEGIAINSNRNELIMKMAANQKTLNNKVNLQYDFSYMKYRNDYNNTDFNQALSLNPTYPVYDDANTNSGGYFIPDGSGASNPVWQMNTQEKYQDGNYFRGSVKATVSIMPTLKFNVFGAVEDGDNYEFYYGMPEFYERKIKGNASRKVDSNTNKLFESTFDYVNSFGKSSLTGVLGVSYQYFMKDESNMSNSNFDSDINKYYNMENGSADKLSLTVSSYRNSNTLIAAFGRINYNYDDKYLLSASLRAEGSSRFGNNNKVGYFPAISLGWVLDREEFIKQIDFINELKVRAGFGITGNNLANDLRSKELLSKGGTFWYNGSWINTYKVSQNPNPDLKWEKKYEYNLGIDFSLLKNKLFGTVDVYMRQTKDLLAFYNVPQTQYLYDRLLANAGQVDSKGLELTLNYVAVKNNNFSWTTSPTISFNNNVLVKLSNPALGLNYDQADAGYIGGNGLNNMTTQRLIEGYPVGTFYGYKFLGVNAGGSHVYEKDENGQDKLQVIGNAQPKLNFGWMNSFKYKKFDFGIFLRGIAGNDVLNVKRMAYGPQPSASRNLFKADLKSGTIGTQSKFSDFYLENGTFVKIDNISLGYNFAIKNNAYVKNLRVYFTAQNVFAITGYSGIDPELNVTSVNDSGIDPFGFYPSVRNFMVGLNITL